MNRFFPVEKQIEMVKVSETDENNFGKSGNYLITFLFGFITTWLVFLMRFVFANKRKRKTCCNDLLLVTEVVNILLVLITYNITT